MTTISLISSSIHPIKKVKGAFRCMICGRPMKRNASIGPICQRRLGTPCKPNRYIKSSMF